MASNQIHLLPTDKIKPSRSNPRTVFDPDELRRMAGTIVVAGVEQPVHVLPADEDGFHELISGEMRWRGSQLAGCGTVPAIIHDGVEDPKQVAISQLRENCCRFELAPLDLAAAIELAIAENGFTATEVARLTGLSEGHVSKVRSLLRLPPEVRTQIQSGTLAASSAYELLKLEGADAQRQAAASATSERLTRDGLARKIRRGQKAARTPRRKVTMPVAPGTSFAVVSTDLSLLTLTDWLARLAERARSAQANGLTLEAFIKSLATAKSLRKAGAK